MSHLPDQTAPGRHPPANIISPPRRARAAPAWPGAEPQVAPRPARPGTEGGYTRYLPGGEQLTIFEAAQRNAADGVPLLVIAGREYGSGSSRDWAANGTAHLGVRAVLALSFERIHRANLIGMSVLPLQFAPGEDTPSPGLTGQETDFVGGLGGSGELPRTVTVTAASGTSAADGGQQPCPLALLPSTFQRTGAASRPPPAACRHSRLALAGRPGPQAHARGACGQTGT